MQTERQTHTHMYHLHKWFNIIYSIKKVFNLNQIKSCGLSNLVKSQSTCNKKSGQKQLIMPMCIISHLKGSLRSKRSRLVSSNRQFCGFSKWV